MLLAVIFTFILLFLVFDYMKTKNARDLFAAANIQGPPTTPIFGNILNFVSRTPEGKSFLYKFNEPDPFFLLTTNPFQM